MDNRQIITLLKDQLRLFEEREKAYPTQLGEQAGLIREQTTQIEALCRQIDELGGTIKSLEESLTLKNASMGKFSAQNRGLTKLLSNPSEKVIPPKESKAQAPSPK